MTAYLVAVLALLALAVPALRHLREAPPLETRLDVVTPATRNPIAFELSPDGRQIVFVASGPNGPQLWLRSLASTTARPLAGTEEALSPFWSPNSSSIGFFADGSLKTLDLGGGAPQTLAPAENGAGGTWNADGVIVFAPSLTSQLMRISAAGGAVTPVLALGPRESGHIRPHFLPDGFRFLFFATGDPDDNGIHIGTLGGSVSTRLTPADGDAQFLPTGWLLWVRAGALVAQRLDLARPVLTRERLTLADGVPTDFWFRSAFSAASNGSLAYRAGGGSKQQLTWFDRSGTAQGTLGDADNGFLGYPRLTPDGGAVVRRVVQGNFDLWLLDGSRRTRITFDPARDESELLSPDGTVVAFRSNRSGPGDLYTKLLGRADSEELLLSSDELKAPTSWSADGRFLMYTSASATTHADLWVLPMQGNRKAGDPYIFLQTPFREAYGVISPDGRWVAYQSNESGHPEVYVRRFFEPGQRDAVTAGEEWQVSTDGGVYAAWRADGQELYYVDRSGALMAVPITVTGNTFGRGTPQRLFRTRISGGGRDSQQGRMYDVAANGMFLVNIDLDEDVGTAITLIQNWNPDSK